MRLSVALSLALGLLVAVHFHLEVKAQSLDEHVDLLIRLRNASTTLFRKRCQQQADPVRRCGVATAQAGDHFQQGEAFKLNRRPSRLSLVDLDECGATLVVFRLFWQANSGIGKRQSLSERDHCALSSVMRRPTSSHLSKITPISSRYLHASSAAIFRP